ncbi:hypothetical protein D3C76_1630940 [compost metagenome]
MQGDRLALQFAQLQWRNHYAAVLPGQKGDDPACGGLVFTAEGVELVDLASAAHLEQRLQRCQVGFAELSHVGGFQGQLDRLARAQATAVHTGGQLCCLCLGSAEQQAMQQREQ